MPLRPQPCLTAPRRWLFAPATFWLSLLISFVVTLDCRAALPAITFLPPPPAPADLPRYPTARLTRAALTPALCLALLLHPAAPLTRPTLALLPFFMLPRLFTFIPDACCCVDCAGRLIHASSRLRTAPYPLAPPRPPAPTNAFAVALPTLPTSPLL